MIFKGTMSEEEVWRSLRAATFCLSSDIANRFDRKHLHYPKKACFLEREDLGEPAVSEEEIDAMVAEVIALPPCCRSDGCMGPLRSSLLGKDVWRDLPILSRTSLTL